MAPTFLTMVVQRLVLVVGCLLVTPPVVAQSSNFGFEGLEQSLRLSPWQKQQFDVAVTATQRAMVAIGLGTIQVKARLAQELLKERPDPDALFKAQDELVEFSRPHVTRAREEWRRFYTMLDDDQLRTARTFVEEKLRLLEKAGEHLAQLLGERLRKP